MMKLILFFLLVGTSCAQFSNGLFRFGNDSPEDLFDDSPEDFLRNRNTNGNRNFGNSNRRNFGQDSRSDEDFVVVRNTNNNRNSNSNRNFLVVDSLEDLFGNKRVTTNSGRNFNRNFLDSDEDSRETIFRFNQGNTRTNTNRNRNSNRNSNRNTNTNRPASFNRNPVPTRRTSTTRTTAPSFFSINRNVNRNSNRNSNRNRFFRDSDEDSRENAIFRNRNRNRNTNTNRNRNTNRVSTNRNTRPRFGGNRNNRNRFNSRESVEFNDLFDDSFEDRIRARNAISRFSNSGRSNTRRNSNFESSFVTLLGGPNSRAPVGQLPSHFSSATHRPHTINWSKGLVSHTTENPGFNQQTTTQRPRTTKKTVTKRPTTQQRPTTPRPATPRPTTFRPTTRRPTTFRPTTRRPTTFRPKTTRRPKISQKPSVFFRLDSIESRENLFDDLFDDDFDDRVRAQNALSRLSKNKHNSITSKLNTIRNPSAIGPTKQVGAFGFPSGKSPKNFNFPSPDAIRNIALNLISPTKSSLPKSAFKSAFKSPLKKSGFSNWPGGNGYYVSMSTGGMSPFSYFISLDDKK